MGAPELEFLGVPTPECAILRSMTERLGDRIHGENPMSSSDAVVRSVSHFEGGFEETVTVEPATQGCFKRSAKPQRCERSFSKTYEIDLVGKQAKLTV